MKSLLLIIIFTTLILVTGFTSNENMGVIYASLRHSNTSSIQATETTRRKNFVSELQSLSSALKKKKIDISRECKNSEDVDNLNYNSASGDVIIVAAAYDVHMNEKLFKKKYPEIWRRSAVIAIEDFDDSGRKKILCRIFSQSSNPLKLRMFDPLMLPAGKEKILGGNIDLVDIEKKPTTVLNMGLPTYRSDDPIHIIRKKSGTWIEVFHQDRPFTRDSGKRTFFFHRIILEYTGRAFKIIDEMQTEFDQSKFIPPEQFFVNFD